MVSDLTVVFSVDALGFFYSALPPEGELSLDDLHVIIGDIWLSRHDEDLEQELTKRRKGRPKSVKEMQIEELKVREAEEYRTGFGSFVGNILASFELTSSFPTAEVPDLTHEINVELFRGWDQKEGGYLQMLRYIRISSTDPEKIIVSRPGQHPRLTSAANAKTTETTPSGGTGAMDVTE